MTNQLSFKKTARNLDLVQELPTSPDPDGTNLELIAPKGPFRRD